MPTFGMPSLLLLLDLKFFTIIKKNFENAGASEIWSVYMLQSAPYVFFVSDQVIYS